MIFDKFGSYGFLNDDGLTPAPLILYDLGVEHRQNENYFFDNASRSNYEGFLFQYTLEGSGYFEIGGNKEKMEAGSAFLVSFPDESRYYIDSAPDHGWRFFYLHFDGYLAQQIVSAIQEKSGSCLHFHDSPSFLNVFRQEYTALQSGKHYEKYEASCFLYQFLTFLLRETELHGKPIVSTIEKGRQWLNQHYASPFSLSELCDRLHISLPHFSRQFHSRYGISPLAYLNHLRLECAITLLLNSTLSMKEIAGKCGFSDSNYFAKVFRKHVGMSPSEYRLSRKV